VKKAKEISGKQNHITAGAGQPGGFFTGSCLRSYLHQTDFNSRKKRPHACRYQPSLARGPISL